jgi:hypothetical protein
MLERLIALNNNVVYQAVSKNFKCSSSVLTQMILGFRLPVIQQVTSSVWEPSVETLAQLQRDC